MGANGWSAVCRLRQTNTALSYSSFSLSVLPVPGWFSIREAEANIQGSAGFGPEQYGREGGWGTRKGGVSGQKENEMLPVAPTRQSTSDVFL